MRLHAAVFALALTGIVSSIAIAPEQPLGDGSPATGARIEICHRTGSPGARLRTLSVSRANLESHMRHGDLLVPSGGACEATGSATS